MKRSVIALLLILVLTLTACGSAETDAPMEIVRSTEETTAQTEAAEMMPADNSDMSFDGPFAFTADGVTLTPGQQFDAAQLPAADSVYQVPSCAIEGTDNVYNYGTYEVTAFQDDSGEMIYSIYILDANIATAEGLALGDRLEKVVELYGEGYEVNGTEYSYVSEGTILSIIVQNDVVISIEYRLDV